MPSAELVELLEDRQRWAGKDDETGAFERRLGASPATSSTMRRRFASAGPRPAGVHATSVPR